MSFEFYAVRFGAPAAALLQALVRVEQRDDPLAPVTVVVPDNLTGVMARRSLAAAGGVANVSFLTPGALAARLAGGGVAEAGPLEVAAAARHVLARQTRGLFAPVAAHPATEVAVVAAHQALAGAAPDTLAELAASPSARTRAVVDLHRSITGRLAPLVNEHELARQAVARVAAAPACAAPLGALVVHLVDELPPAHAELLAALAEHRPVSVLIGVTGAAEADTASRWWSLLAPAGAVDTSSAELVRLPARPVAFSATDSDDEVRHVVREVFARAEAGVPLARMAVLWSTPTPYARLVHEHLAAADLAHNGPGVRPLAGFVAGRAALGLLALDAARWSRAEVIDLASIAPGEVRGGGPRPVVRWDSISRRAGVVGGRADWSAKLAEHAGAARNPAERHEIEALAAFVAELSVRVDAGRACTTWPALAPWLAESLRWLVGDPAGWPPAELRALETVVETIGRLAGLGAIEQRPTLESCRRALVTALDAPSQREGVLGRGVQCGPLEHARALDVDVVFVVGLAEGLCPAPATEDTLLPDTERRLARHGELALATSRVAAAHRALLMAFTAARAECVVGYPRGDHRGGRSRLPSRWLDHVALVPGSPATEELFAHPRGGVLHLASFEAALVTASTWAHAAEARLAGLRPSGPAFATHPAASAGLVRAAEAFTARASSAFTEWDANLGGRPVPSPAGTTTSSTRLEAWAECPFRYYAATVLRLTERDTPEAIDQVDARERGSLVHTVLERFILEHLDEPPAPDQPWPAEATARLQEIATEEFRSAEARGVTGPAVRWRRDQLELRRLLDAFVQIDNSLRATFASTPVRAELAFGIVGDPASGPELAVPLADGRTLTFRGVVDRVDRTPDGLLVVDYKTGKSTPPRISPDDPFVRGTKLQLPLYALAARQVYEAPAAEAHYLYVEQGGERRGYRVDDALIAQFTGVLARITDGIEEGVFVARPGEFNNFFGTHQTCAYCDFDRLCSARRGEQWTAKTTAVAPGSALARYLELAGEAVAP